MGVMAGNSSPADQDPAGRAKRQLRRELRARRAAQPRKAARAAAKAAIRRLWSLPQMARARRIAVYLPVGSEFDCTGLVREAWRRGRRVFLPVITRRGLSFAPFHAWSALRANRFGIPEPAAGAGRWRRARELDVVIAPLLAFDRQGRRLGMGGGYYDRTLAFRTRRRCARRPHFIALAFELQRLDALPSDSWDVRLDAVVTESATHRFA